MKVSTKFQINPSTNSWEITFKMIWWLTDQPTNRPTNRPTDQPTNWPNNQPTNHPTDQPTSQPTDQPTSQPTNQPTNGWTKSHSDFKLLYNDFEWHVHLFKLKQTWNGSIRRQNSKTDLKRFFLYHVTFITETNLQINLTSSSQPSTDHFSLVWPLDGH